MAILPTALACARDWTKCALNLAFPWPEGSGIEATPIEPPFCRQCGEPFPALAGEPEFACTNCENRTWHFDWARAGYRAEGDVREAVTGFKYRDEYYHRSRLVGWLIEVFDRYARGGDWHALVPVPLYHRRRRERGFNQAAELAHGLGRERQLPVWDCLYRYRETPSQTSLERAERWQNMAGAFRMNARFDVRGRNLLLLDDVFTTGATTNACARVLAKAGAGRLAVLSVARS
jgi:competence protein ComFC